MTRLISAAARAAFGFMVVWVFGACSPKAEVDHSAIERCRAGAESARTASPASRHSVLLKACAPLFTGACRETLETAHETIQPVERLEVVLSRCAETYCPDLDAGHVAACRAGGELPPAARADALEALLEAALQKRYGADADTLGRAIAAPFGPVIVRVRP